MESYERINSMRPAGVFATACKQRGPYATREVPAVIAVFDQLATRESIKFGNRVRTNFFERLPGFEHFPGGAGFNLYYMWPSGSNVITITFNTRKDHEEFLRLYLEKFPSSIN